MQPATFKSRTRLTSALTALLLFGIAAPAWPGDAPDERATLKGLTAIQVVLERLDPEAERDGLTRDQLQTAVEVRLRIAGIKVTSSREEAGYSYLYLNVNTFKDRSGLYALNIQIEFE